jgi:glucokinase
VLSISTLENWRSVPLRAKLNKIVSCLVIIENDTNLAAQGERYCGAAKGEETFILIHIGPNVGAGIVLDGQIHHGAQWSAGEIGYLRLPSTSRKRPTLHEFGELETVLTRAGVPVEQRAAIVADLVINLSLILNPGLILLEGKVGGDPALIDEVHKQLQESEFGVTRISAGTLGDTSVLWGGIAIGLEMVPSVLLPGP